MRRPQSRPPVLARASARWVALKNYQQPHDHDDFVPRCAACYLEWLIQRVVWRAYQRGKADATAAVTKVHEQPGATP